MRKRGFETVVNIMLLITHQKCKLHPYSLLLYRSLKDDMDKFLGVLAKERDEGKIKVMTMGEFREYLTEKRVVK